LDNVLIKNTKFLIICKYRPHVVRLRLAARPPGSCSPHCGASANFTGKKWTQQKEFRPMTGKMEKKEFARYFWN
jgi:hypothetical protein